MSQGPNTIVCRIQDKEGRGPYRPGFSHNWSEREDGPLPIQLAFPGIGEKIKLWRALNGGGHFGCAFRNKDQAARWFSPNEVLTLAGFGYRLVWMHAEIVAENDDQLVIFSMKPLAETVIHSGWSSPEVAA